MSKKLSKNDILIADLYGEIKNLNARVNALAHLILIIENGYDKFDEMQGIFNDMVTLYSSQILKKATFEKERKKIAQRVQALIDQKRL